MRRESRPEGANEKEVGEGKRTENRQHSVRDYSFHLSIVFYSQELHSRGALR